MKYIEWIKSQGWKLWWYKDMQCCTMNNGYCFSMIENTKYFESKKALKKHLDTFDRGE